jgi:hypothetical protein
MHERQTKGGIIVPMTIEVEQEEDGRWLAEVPDLPGVLTYGQTRQEAIEECKSFACASSLIGWTTGSLCRK